MKYCPTCGRTYPDEFLFCGEDGSNLEVQEGSSDPMIGRILMDQWEIVEHLGAGGFGTVYKAKDRRGNIDAVKIFDRERLHPGHATEARLRFETEADLIKDLGDDSANIVGLRAFSEDADAGLVFFVMEFVEGKTLKDLLAEQGPFDIDRAMDITEQIASGLSVAHKDGVVHRDLKLSNLMLARGRAGHDLVKILDFGIAKVLETSKRQAFGTTRHSPGTPGYAAPEQLFEVAKVDARTDLYALGVVLYSLLVGKEPPLGETITGRTSRGREFLTHEEDGRMMPLTEWNSDISPALENLIIKLHQRRPEDRFQSADEVIAAIRVIRTSPLPRKTRKLLYHGVGWVVVLIGIIALISFFRTRTYEPSALLRLAEDATVVKVSSLGFEGKLPRAWLPDRRFRVKANRADRDSLVGELRDAGIDVGVDQALIDDLLTRIQNAADEKRWQAMANGVIQAHHIDPGNSQLLVYSENAARFLRVYAMKDSLSSRTGIENLRSTCEALPYPGGECERIRR